MTTRRRTVAGRPPRPSGVVAPAPAGIRPWLASIGLALLGLVPGVAGLLAGMAGAQGAAPADAAASLSLAVHAVTGTAFTVLGAFQFPTVPRRRGRGFA